MRGEARYVQSSSLSDMSECSIVRFPPALPIAALGPAGFAAAVLHKEFIGLESDKFLLVSE
jgi:hypothetical protein